LEENGKRRMPHRLYSPELAPGEVYLYATVKETPEWIQVTDEDSFFEHLPEILTGIDQEEFNDVFQAWMTRIQEVSQGNGDPSDDK
jgi:hypothetical protein